MIKYTVAWYRLSEDDIDIEQMTKWFDDIVDAEKARVVLLNENPYLRERPNNLRVVQYEFK